MAADYFDVDQKGRGDGTGHQAIKGGEMSLLCRVTPWWLLRFINRHTRTCWTRMVMWKLYGDEVAWGLQETCWDGPKGQEYDYCERYETEEEFREALEK